MNLFSFALILAVDIVIKEELLTYALIIWGLILLGRFMFRQYLPGANYQQAKTGRHYY
jgi:hypothetical protein